MSDFDDDSGGGGDGLFNFGIYVAVLIIVAVIVAAIFKWGPFKPKASTGEASGGGGGTPSPSPSPSPAPIPRQAECTPSDMSYLTQPYAGHAQVAPGTTNGDMLNYFIRVDTNGDPSTLSQFVSSTAFVTEAALFGVDATSVSDACLACVGTVPLTQDGYYFGPWQYTDLNMNTIGPTTLEGCVSLAPDGTPTNPNLWSLVGTPIVQYPAVLQEGSYWNKYYKATTDPNDPDCLESWKIEDTTTGSFVSVDGRLSTYSNQGSWCMRNSYVSAENTSEDTQMTVWDNCVPLLLSPRIGAIQSRCA